jgi:hypothetical protein
MTLMNNTNIGVNTHVYKNNINNANNIISNHIIVTNSNEIVNNRRKNSDEIM